MGSEASRWQRSEMVSLRSGPARLKPFLSKSLNTNSPTWSMLGTLQNWMGANCRLWILSAVALPARIFPWPERAPDWPVNAPVFSCIKFGS